MREQQRDVNLAYRIARINTTRFSFNDLEENQVAYFFENEDKLKISLDVNMEISLDRSEIFFEIHTSLSDKKNGESIIAHTGKTTFSVQNLANAFDKKNEKFDLPDGLIVQLYALSYSHARALLSVELNRTVFKDAFYLPVIDPTEILAK